MYLIVRRSIHRDSFSFSNRFCLVLQNCCNQRNVANFWKLVILWTFSRLKVAFMTDRFYCIANKPQNLVAESRRACRNIVRDPHVKSNHGSPNAGTMTQKPPAAGRSTAGLPAEAYTAGSGIGVEQRSWAAAAPARGPSGRAKTVPSGRTGSQRRELNCRVLNS